MRPGDERDDELARAGALMAIDASLRGEPTDPEYAPIAELALLLRDERPACPPVFAAELDARVARRFAAEPASASASAASRRRWWQGVAGWSVGATAVVAALAAVVVIGGGGGMSSASSSSASAGAAGVSSSSSSSGGSGASAGSIASAAPSSTHAGSGFGAQLRSSAGSASASSAPASSSSSSSVPAAPTPVPSPKRQIVQGAQLALSTAPGRIDAVAQEIFNAVGDEQGNVIRSSVTATGTTSGGADFQLSVPSANLATTLDVLSRLPGASVVSRTDSSSDITGEIGGAGMRLAEARALRASLLRQLAATSSATTAAALRARIAAVDRTIGADEASLNGLHRQVAYSQISVTLAAVTPPVHHSGAGPFSLRRALHDAGRVLVVIAGVGLIALAVLVPVGLVVAVLGWGAYALRRRRREHALDLV